jgi:hypothetical protein
LGECFKAQMNIISFKWSVTVHWVISCDIKTNKYAYVHLLVLISYLNEYCIQETRVRYNMYNIRLQKLFLCTLPTYIITVSFFTMLSHFRWWTYSNLRHWVRTFNVISQNVTHAREPSLYYWSRYMLFMYTDFGSIICSWNKYPYLGEPKYENIFNHNVCSVSKTWNT